nr:hypothetical protein [uncultured Fretibacterium sp.]
MPGLGSTRTLRDLAIDHGLGDDPVVEILSKSTPLIADMAFRNGNQTDGHKFKVRAGLPGVTWRALNEGVVPTRSSQKHVRETCAMLEAVSEVDKKYIDMEDDQALARLEESEAFIEAMGQEFAASVWYGDTGFEPKGIMGLSKRYGSLTGPANEHIIDCGGTGNNNASVWLVIHSTKDFFGVVPKNSKVGLQHKASGVIDLIDPDNGGTYEGYRDRFQWDVGVCLRDYRQIVRACNIDVTKLPTFGTASDQAADLLLIVNDMTNRVFNLNSGRAVIYMNRTLKRAWEHQLLKSHYIEKSIDQATGAITTSYKGIPIHKDDSLLDTEERVI